MCHKKVVLKRVEYVCVETKALRVTPLDIVAIAPAHKFNAHESYHNALWQCLC